jgi:prepilin-type processing-associated H-X9-DG protein
MSGQNQTVEQVYQGCAGITNFSAYTAGNQFSCRGRNWVHSDYTTARYNHVMPPNTHSCSQTTGGSINVIPVNENEGATTASSGHNSGVNIVFADGSTHFVGDSVDRVIWNSLGSRDGDEPKHGPF